MEKSSASKVRASFNSYLDKVCAEHEPLIIIRRNGENVVVLPEEDYNSMLETFYLLKSPKNARRLFEAKKRKTGLPFEEIRKSLGI